MSRLPPPPPGLPPKPAADSYRPNLPPQEPRSARESMYQFGGGQDPRDSYDQRSSSRHNYDSYTPSGPASHAPGTRPSGDMYRPQDNHDFTFRYDAPPSIASRQSDTWRPRSPPRQRNYGQENSRGYGRLDRQRNGGQRNGYAHRGRGGPRTASDREFLRTNRAPTPELMPGINGDDAHGVKYMRVEDVSDSEEADMDFSEDDDDGQPKKKQARTETKAADGDSVPQWSNPDPYTALPPPDESQRKKKDVVKLIRKARVEVNAANTVKATEAAADDFISLDFGGDNFGGQIDGKEDEEEDPERFGKGVPGAPSGPRASLQQPQAPAPSFQAINVPTRDSNALTSNHATMPPKLSNVVDLTRDDDLGSRKRTANDEIKAPPKGLDTRVDPNLGTRKRNVRDEIKPPPMIHKITRGKPPRADGGVLKEWLVPRGENGTPWLDIDHSDTAVMGVWLHKEIIDFYEYVKPREFENVIRARLVEDLRMKVKQYYPNADIRCFGSFPAGLYLPTADMDLVCVSNEFLQTGQKILGQNNKGIRRFADFLRRNNLAIPESIDMILKAKVPLVKYVDRLTGLKVDISFENSTGLVANKTFQDWKAQYPAVPILVTLIKHLLAMRGLNEPVNGGIGGFSVTCLVVSLLQNMPQVQSRSMIPEHHLGEVLMEFLDLYGNQFDVATTAIQFDPPGYVSKAHVGTFTYKSGPQEKFSIIDPNNPSNDISGGSSNTAAIRDLFSHAYNALQRRAGELQYSSDRKGQSILGCIFAGNYRSFKLQREHLEHVHEKLFGPVTV